MIPSRYKFNSFIQIFSYFQKCLSAVVMTQTPKGFEFLLTFFLLQIVVFMMDVNILSKIVVKTQHISSRRN